MSDVRDGATGDDFQDPVGVHRTSSVVGDVKWRRLLAVERFRTGPTSTIRSLSDQRKVSGKGSPDTLPPSQGYTLFPPPPDTGRMTETRRGGLWLPHPERVE